MKRGLSMAMLALLLLGCVGAGNGAWADKRDDVLRERARINALKAQGLYPYRNNYRNMPYGYYRSNYVRNVPPGNRYGHFKNRNQRDRWEAARRWNNRDNRRWDRWDNARQDNDRWNNRRNDNFISRWF